MLSVLKLAPCLRKVNCIVFCPEFAFRFPHNRSMQLPCSSKSFDLCKPCRPAFLTVLSSYEAKTMQQTPSGATATFHQNGCMKQKRTMFNRFNRGLTEAAATMRTTKSVLTWQHFERGPQFRPDRWHSCRAHCNPEVTECRYLNHWAAQ